MTRQRFWTTPTLLAAWIGVGVFMLICVGRPSVTRTQEARVLETAREMAERPIAEWPIPKLNGALRLRKPPLAYWLSAASFRIVGVSDFAGRLPAAILSWFTLALTFLLGRRWFSARVGGLAALVMAGTWLFFRHGLLAETDIVAAFFVTLGIYAVLRAADEPTRNAWPHVVAIAIAGAVMAKGPPAAYILLFWVGLCWFRRDWRSLGRFVTRGAVLTMLLLAVPWFVYIARHTTAEGQLGADLTNSADGGDHHAPPWYYAVLLIRATAPWTAVWVAALLMAGERFFRLVQMAWRRRARSNRSLLQARPYRRVDRSLVELALGGGSVLVPLCFWGNKQFHYLLPVMPATAILIGWALDGSIRHRRSARAATVTLIVTAAILLLAGPAVVIAAMKVRGHVIGADFVVGAVLVAGAIGVAVAFRRGRLATTVAVGVLAWLSIAGALIWVAPLAENESREAAMEVTAAHPAGKFYFRGSELPVMSWSMRRSVPLIAEDGFASLAADPAAVVLEQQQNTESTPTPPAGFVRERQINQGENLLHVYVPRH